MSSRHSWDTATRSLAIVVASAAILMGTPACADAGANKVAVEMWYPPGSGLVTVASLTVRGGSSNPSTIAAVRVNGVLATTTNGFVEWEAEIPLASGANAVIVEGEDVAGQVATVATVTITRSSTFALWGAPTAAVLDPYAPRALVLDSAPAFLDLETGARDTVSDDWPSDALNLTLAAALDIASNRALVVTGRREDDPGTDLPSGAGPVQGLYEIDLDTGVRTVVSDARRGSGPPLRWPFVLAIDQEHQRAVIIERESLSEGPTTIVGVDLGTGDRTVLSGNGIGSGVEFGELNDLALDPAGDVAYVLDATQGALLSIDLSTGARAVVASGLDIERPPHFEDPGVRVLRSNLELDAVNHRALILNGRSGELQAIDLSTGERTLLAANVAPGENGHIEGFMFDGQRNRVIFHVHDTFRALDLATGEHQRLSTTYVGDGPLMKNLHGVAGNEADDRAYITVQRESSSIGGDALDIGGGVLEIDLTTGNRRIAVGLSAVAEGEYGLLDQLESIVVDENHGRLLMNGFLRSEVIAVTLETGETDVLWDARAAFPDVHRVEVMDLALHGDEVLVATRLEENHGELEDTLVTVALDSGEWEILSGMGTGTGRALTHLTSIVTAPEDGVAFVGEAASCSVLGIDLATGNRDLVFQSAAWFDCFYDVYAYDRVRGRLVTNFSREGGGGLHFIDTDTGDITPIPVDRSIRWRPSEPTLDRHGYSLIGIDTQLRALIAIDPASGAVVLLSR